MSWLAFLVLGFDFPVVFGVLSGVSVLIPYIGMLAVAVPLLLQGYLQWGLELELLWLMLAYSVIQFLDGNVLVPMMLSHAVKLHPVSILLALVLFGSLWGFWGAFFAIPLATFLKILTETVVEHRGRLMEGRE